MSNSKKYDYAKILEAYKTKTTQEVAEEFGCSTLTVYRIAKAKKFHKKCAGGSKDSKGVQG